MWGPRRGRCRLRAIAWESLPRGPCRLLTGSPRGRRRDDDDRCHDRGPPERGPDRSHPRPIREACACEQSDGQGDSSEDERPCREPRHLREGQDADDDRCDCRRDESRHLESSSHERAISRRSTLPENVYQCLATVRSSTSSSQGGGATSFLRGGDHKLVPPPDSSTRARNQNSPVRRGMKTTLGCDLSLAIVNHSPSSNLRWTS